MTRSLCGAWCNCRTFCRTENVRKETNPTYRTLAKAQAALAIAILTYIPIRLKNLLTLEFDTHLFIRTAKGAISTLELSDAEVKNNVDLAFDIPPQIVKMLVEYRERIAPKILGQRPSRLFINVDGTPKTSQSFSTLIANYARRRAGITLTPHEFRHLSAKILLDQQPGAFEPVRQLVGRKNSQTTVSAYAGNRQSPRRSAPPGSDRSSAVSPKSASLSHACQSAVAAKG